MSVTFVGVTPPKQANGAGSVTLAKPPGVIAGDLLILQWTGFYDSGDADFAGWTLIKSDNNGGGVGDPYVSANFLYRVAQASDTSWTFSAAYYDEGAIAAYRGADVGPAAVTWDTNSNTSQTAPSVTMAKPGMVLRFYTMRNAAVTGVSGAAQRYAVGNFNGGISLHDQQLAAAGATGTATGTSSSSGACIATTIGLTQQNSAPNAPTLTGPANNATLNRGITQRFAWNFSDPDAGDTQSWFRLRYRLVGAGTWTVVDGSTPNTYWDAPAGTFAAGDYEWQVATRDAQGLPASDADLVFSSSAFFTAATPPPGPTITAPTNGATVGLPEVEVQWSYPSQEAYRLQVLDGSGNTLTDTGQVNNTTARSYLVDLPTNNVTRTVRLQVLDGGLWSAWVAVTFDVSYTPPPAPVVSLLPDPDDGALVVTITNPSPGAGEPATSYNDVLVDDGAGEERRATEVAPNSSWTYWLPKAGRDYTGSVRVVAVGDNGTSSSS